MDYLEVYCLVTKCLDIFLLFLLLISSLIALWLENTLYGFNYVCHFIVFCSVAFSCFPISLWVTWTDFKISFGLSMFMAVNINSA